MKRPATNSPRRRPSPRGIVRGDVVYSLRAFSRVTGLREHGLRQLRALGLPMVQVGRERWILGADFLALVRRLRDKRGQPSDCQTDQSLTE